MQGREESWETNAAAAIHEVTLDQRISFRLQRGGTRLTTRAVNIRRWAIVLTLKQRRLLKTLSKWDGASVHELNSLGYVDKATMSRDAAELMRQGLLVSETSKNDPRITVLRVTREGHRVLEAVDPLVNKRQNESINSLTESERQALLRALDKLETVTC